MKTLIPVLGDQLSLSLSALRDQDQAACVVLMMEVVEETGYVRHHQQKIAYILSAMRHHADALRAAGWTVDYQRLDDAEAADSFTGAVAAGIARHAPAGRRCSACPSPSAPTTASSPVTTTSRPGPRDGAS